jgi:hypothetical protein
MFYVSITVPDFFRDACTAMGRNTCEMLRLAGQEVTIPAVQRFITSIPSSWRHLESGIWRGMSFHQTVQLARERCKDTPDAPRCLELLDYFFIQVPELDAAARQMLEQAFIGVLEGIEPKAVALDTARNVSEQPATEGVSMRSEHETGL